MSEPVTCCKCGADMGEIITIRGLDVLKVGNHIIHNLPSHCFICGASFYFNADQRKMDKIIREWRAKDIQLPPSY